LPFSPVVLRQRAVALLPDTGRVLPIDVDDRAAAAVSPLEPVRLATTARERFVTEHLKLGHLQLRGRDEEPLALTDERRRSPARPLLPPQTRRRLANRLRTKRALRTLHTADAASRLGDRRREPVALVIAAEEAPLLVAVADQQEQMTLRRSRIDHVDANLRAGAREAQLEVLAASIGTDVHVGHAALDAARLDASADQTKTTLECLDRHLTSPL
jgi:hypothetical protein